MYKFTYPRALWDEQKIDKAIIRRLIQKHIAMNGIKAKCYRYYIGHHDIEHRTRDDKDAPNARITCNHARDISDTAAGYFMGSPISYTTTGDHDIEPLIDAFDTAGIDDVDADLALDGSIFGLAYEYVYADSDGNATSKAVSPLSAFVVCDDTIAEAELFGVYYWNRKNDATDSMEYVATVMTEHYIYNLVVEGAATPGIVHEWTTEEPTEHFFGGIPLVEYLNNKEALGDFEGQLSLIDAYNALMSDRVTDKEQFIDSILALYGALLGDDEAETDEALKKLKEQKLIELPIDAKAEYLTRQMDEDGAEVLRKALKEDIYTFSHVPNLTDESFAGTTSGVALEYKLLGLEMLTKTKERHYRQGLRKRVRLYCNFLGLKAISVEAGAIIPAFTRALPKNLQELSLIVSNLEGKVSSRTLLSLLPFVEDPEGEIEAVNEEKEQALAYQERLYGIAPNTLPDELQEEDEGEV